jgi:hypothetical protein
MKGTILNFNNETNEITISGDDNNRYRSNLSQWRENTPPQATERVDFGISGNDASDVYRLAGHHAPKVPVAINGKEELQYLGIIALIFPIVEFLFRVHHKIFLLLYTSQHSAMYDSFSYKATSTILQMVFYFLPVLLVVKIKNSGLKIAVIFICTVLFIFQFLSTFDIYNWNNFWYNS